MIPDMKNLTLGIILLSFSFTGAQSQRYEARYDATDTGPILRHGDGPDNCDARGMREPSIVQEDGKFFLFYDGCAAPGWLACLATSDDLKTWKKHGPQLSLGPAGSDDSASPGIPSRAENIGKNFFRSPSEGARAAPAHL